MPGNSGKSFQDRQRHAKVRNLTLDLIEECLTKGTVNGKKAEKRFQEALLLKLAGTALPRLNEHAGEDGGDIKMNHTIRFVRGK